MWFSDIDFAFERSFFVIIYERKNSPLKSNSTCRKNQMALYSTQCFCGLIAWKRRNTKSLRMNKKPINSTMKTNVVKLEQLYWKHPKTKVQHDRRETTQHTIPLAAR